MFLSFVLPINPALLDLACTLFEGFFTDFRFLTHSEILKKIFEEKIVSRESSFSLDRERLNERLLSP